MTDTKIKPSIQSHVDQFLKSIENAGKQLADFSAAVDKRELKIKQSLHRFYMMIQDTTKTNTASSELKQLVDDMIHTYKEKAAHWISLIDSHIEGKEFINQFEKSILLTVFGNVNSGKSTLGNFVAGIPFENSPISYSDRPPFFVYDWGSNQKEVGAVPLAAGQFKENHTEETSTIQYYTLKNGLTWVDTPGIHSLNIENEALAKKYVDFADLVLFVVSSSSPGKADEIIELKKLMDKEKPILLMITKSDRTIRDEVNGEIVTLLLPKDEETRRSQENYVDGAISEKGIHDFLKDRRYVSVSVRLAVKAIIEKDEALFEQSNATKLYEQIGQVINAHAIELKTERPKKEINSTIRELMKGFEMETGTVEGTEAMRKSFQQVLNQIHQRKQQLESIKDSLYEELRLSTSGIIESKVLKASLSFDSGQTVDATYLSAEIEQEILAEFNRLLKKKLTQLLADFEYQQAQSLHLKVDPSFESKYEKIEYTEYQYVEKQRDPRGVIEHIQAIVFNKQFTEPDFQERKRTKNVRVGNNAAEVVEKIIHQTFDQLLPVINKTIQTILVSYFTEHEKVMVTILQGLDELEATLERLTF